MSLCRTGVELFAVSGGLMDLASRLVGELFN